MSHWIDFDMLMGEINLHRSNVQRRIQNYKEGNHPLPTHPSEYTSREFVNRLLYENEVGAEKILMCLQRWCQDFKFSSDEVKNILNEM